MITKRGPVLFTPMQEGSWDPLSYFPKSLMDKVSVHPDDIVGLPKDKVIEMAKRARLLVEKFGKYAVLTPWMPHLLQLWDGK